MGDFPSKEGASFLDPQRVSSLFVVAAGYRLESDLVTQEQQKNMLISVISFYNLHFGSIFIWLLSKYYTVS